MATLVLSAVGTAIGGPIGGAIGALAGQQLDRAIFSGGGREGPRLKELRVTTSSYGAAIARNYGRLRIPGTIIWATDLVENSETSGGKSSPSTTTYTYSVSFAVALSSRPVETLGRIWADGNLLRGAAGDLKTGGTLRFYDGHGDQPVDPLLASAEGAACPAFRGTAYAVFEDLQLSDFGNRIPALTFEIIADHGEIYLAHLLDQFGESAAGDIPLTGLMGFANEGGQMADSIAAIGSLYPLACDTSGETVEFLPADRLPAIVPLLPEAVAASDGESFGHASGIRRQREAGARDRPDAVRYYDVDRDFQPGLQRAEGRAAEGRTRTVEFPGSLAANDARSLINRAAERAGAARDAISYRIAEVDPALRPGSIVRVPRLAGYWRIDGWEWRENGIELELNRLPRGPVRELDGDAGSSWSPLDIPAGPTALRAFELPWDGAGDGNRPVVWAAPSAASSGWSGAALYADRGGELVPLGSSGSRRSIIGSLLTALTPSPAVLFDRNAYLDIRLIPADLALTGATIAGLANGANRALIGNEVIQFANAEALGGGTWRLSGLLRGRGGSEAAAQAGHVAGTPFVLLDGRPVAFGAGRVGNVASANIGALGLGDTETVFAEVANAGATLRPLTPVHPRVSRLADGSMELSWIRRARGAWNWLDEVETPLNEQAEVYVVGIGEVEDPFLWWEVSEPVLSLSAATVASLETDHPGAALWVRQVGSFAMSPPLLLTTLP
jgi:hypothetical protein